MLQLAIPTIVPGILIAGLSMPAGSTQPWAFKTTPSLDAGGGQSDTGRQQYDNGNCIESTAALRAGAAKNPKDAGANLLVARCYFEHADYERAVAYAGRAVELEPDSSEGHLWLGRSYGLKAEREHSMLLAKRVRREFELAVQLDPGNLAARRDLMEFYLEAPWFLGGSQDKAWQQVEAIAARDAVEGHLARAGFWQGRHQPQQAESEYRAVLALKPRSLEPYLAAAEFYENRANGGEIEHVAEAAAHIRPDDPRLDYYHGVACVLERGPFPEAEQFLKDYLARAPMRSDFPSHAAAYEWLGRLYEQWGRTQQAVERYQTALRLDAHRRKAREALARLHAEQ
jgi:Tfp pilus assembly protein PilF